ncbi:MAG TPA: F0F1 ATP synthase subunit A [Pyrinomonadaceae bacterium]|nr:F0F1 ATP synthase subunit A [Pyrinomonadaceae bacterium]
MLFLFSASEPAAGHAAPAAEHGGGAGGHATPAIVEFVNHHLGKPVHDFQVAYTKPLWEKFFGSFGTTPEKVFGEYTVENAIPWYTVMFVLAAFFSLALVWLLKPRKLSADEPGDGQQTLEAGVLAIRNLLVDNVGTHGLQYLPVVATFGILILVSNLMGLVPGLMPPTAHTSVTFALGISSFVYYNGIGIRENGLLGHLKHFAGPIPWLAVLMFPIELISNMVRPMSLGIRLFGNLFGDEQILGTIGNLAAGLFGAMGLPRAPWLLPVLIMPLSLFVAFMQTFIFVLLSILYIGEVSHAPHEEGHGAESHGLAEGGVVTAPAAHH